MTYRARAGRAVHQAKMLVHRAGFDVTRETFKRHFVRSLHQHGIDTVLDVGANTGQFALELRRADFTGRMLSVEPLGDAFATLSRAAEGDALWTTHRAAVGAHAGVLTMNVAGNSVSSSVLPMLARHSDAAPQTAYVATEDVPATTVVELVAQYGLEPAQTLLKIDVQGYERPVLDGAEPLLADFAGVRTEMSLVPLYDGQVLMPEIMSHLADRGFEMWTIERGFVEPGTGRLLQADGVFFRGGQ
jgi:FkbM family methyltransferase